jgi:hypothetical protein
MLYDLAIRLSKQKKTEIDDTDKDLENKVSGCFEKDYQNWYTESHAVIRQIIPDRLNKFESLFKPDSKRKGLSGTNFVIQDWLNGHRSAVACLGKKELNGKKSREKRRNKKPVEGRV